MFDFTRQIDSTAPLEAHVSSLDSATLRYTLRLAFTLAAPGFWQKRRLPTLELTLGQTRHVYFLEARPGIQCIAIMIERDQLAQPLRLTLRNAQLTTREVTGTLAALPSLEDGPLMIVAPHPDDAEIAAGGLYAAHAAHTHIVTLSAGERLKTLDRQYLNNLDQTLEEAIFRKGWLRSWNAMAGPQLAGVALERCAVLGLPDGHGQAIVRDDKRIDPPFAIAQARRLNRLALPNDAAAVMTREWLIEDLAALIDRWQPTTLLVTDPEYDPHADHQAAALALGLALERTQHQPARLLLYANHYAHAQPPGPAFQPPWAPPPRLRTPLFEAAQPALFALSDEQQRRKALLLQTMNDLGTHESRRQQRRRIRRERFAPTFARGRDEYFQSAVRSGEYFQQVTALDYRRGIARIDAPAPATSA